MRLQSPLFLAINFIFSVASSVLAIPNGTCYSPNGTAITYIDIQPCIQITGIDSMCCATNRTIGSIERAPDICMMNGLCQNELENFATYWRNFCTDPTWTSPNCLSNKVCGEISSSEMTLCADGSWCCGESNYTTCCDGKLGFNLTDNLVQFKLSNEGVVSSSPSGSATSFSQLLAPTQTSTTTSPPTSSASQACDAKSNTGVEPGVMIAACVGLGILSIFGITGGFFAGLRRGIKISGKTKGHVPENVSAGTTNCSTSYAEMGGTTKSAFYAEMSGMPGTPVVAELSEGCSGN